MCILQAKAAVLSLLSHIPLPEIPHGEEGLFESIYLLLTSVIVVPLVCKLPGGSPVLGFLVRASQKGSCRRKACQLFLIALGLLDLMLQRQLT